MEERRRSHTDLRSAAFCPVGSFGGLRAVGLHDVLCGRLLLPAADVGQIPGLFEKHRIFLLSCSAAIAADLNRLTPFYCSLVALAKQL